MASVGVCANLPKRVRVSVGSAAVLGLVKTNLDVAPTTAYLMTHHKKCTANCGFCPQARESSARADLLSRVSWPAFRTMDVFRGVAEAARNLQIKRICIQALNYSGVFCDLDNLTRALTHWVNMPVSVSCQPLNGQNIRRLADSGVERVGIPLDAAAKEVFNRVKGKYAGGPYTWDKQLHLLKKAVEVFGAGRVSTHLIVGLGETEKEMVDTIQACVDLSVLPALFAFTPIRGTALENEAQPSILEYRRMQIARHLISSRVVSNDEMVFDEKGLIMDFGVNEKSLAQIVQTGEPFVTSGCPHCNRPFYNEKPSGPIYNYARPLTSEEVSSVLEQTRNF